MSVNITDGTNGPLRVPHQIAPTGAYHSASDEAGRCPHCYTNGNQVHLGQVTIDSVERPVYHCKQCNKGYTELPTVIKVIADEAFKQGASQVGYSPSKAPLSVDTNASMTPNGHINTYSSQIDETNNQLRTLSSNFNNLTYTIQSLMDQVRNLAEQNNRMMEQLATDPLIHVRKSVAEFNLK